MTTAAPLRCAFLSACLLAGLSTAQAAEPGKGLSLQPDSRNRDVVAILGSQRKPLLLWKIAPIKGAIQGQTLLADSGPGRERYLLLSVDSRSGTGPADGPCGQGVETDLIWIALNDKLEVRKNDIYRLASCLEPVQELKRDDQADGSLRATLLRPAHGGEPARDVTVRYDANNPGQGLQVHDRAR